MRHLVLALILGLILIAPAPAAGQATDEADSAAQARGPQLDAASWVLIDTRSGETLAGHDTQRRRPIASATKMMTAWLAMRELSPSEVVPAAEYAPGPGESLMGLSSGEPVSVRDLLYGLILSSGNDAAVTLAEATAGSLPRFVRWMNREARRMGLGQTSFANPIGLDQKGNYSSAADLAELGRRLLTLPRFRRIAAAREATLRSLASDLNAAIVGKLREARSLVPPRRIETRNTLLFELSWANGIKTGHTSKAGYVLVGSGRRDRTELIAAVLGTASIAARDQETQELLEYGMSLYRTEMPLRKNHALARPEIRFEDERLPLRPQRNLRIGVRADQHLEVKITAPEEVEGPIRRGQRLGRAKVSLDGRPIATVALLAGRPVAEASILDRLMQSPWRYSALVVVVLFVFLIAAALSRRGKQLRPRRSRRE